MRLDFHTLDVFTDTRFGGNPLAVVLEADALSGDAMQTIAREFHLSETVFVMAPGDAANSARLPQPQGVAPSDAMIAAALSLSEADIGFADHRPGIYTAGNAFLFVPLASRAALARARVDTVGWEALEGAVEVGAYLYCAGDGAADYHARLYAPESGVTEDPATGSAAAAMPGALLAGGALDEGANAVTIAQGEDMGRPSLIRLFADIEAGAIARVRVGGQAVRVSSGRVETP